MLWVFAVALVLRVAVFLVGMAHMDASGTNPAFFWHDSGQYLQPATSLTRHGTYSVDSGGKAVPYCLRPPGYPGFIAACYAIGGERIAAILLPQLVLGALGCSLTYWMAAMWFGHRAGIVAGGLMACDQVLIAYSNKVMAETFSICLFLMSTVTLLMFLAQKKQVWLWVCGATLGVATLAHGSTIYYVIIPIAVIASWDGIPARKKVRWAALLLVASLLTTGVWQLRNKIVFGVWVVVPKEHTLVQTAARVRATKRSDKSYAELATEAHRQVDEVFRERYGIERPDWSDAELRQKYFPRFLETQSHVAMEMLGNDTRAFVRAASASFLKMTVMPLPYAEICRFAEAQRLDAKEESLRTTMLRAFKGLLRGEFGQFREAVAKISFCKFVGFGWNAAYWLVTIPAALVGGYLLMRHRNWPACVVLLGTILYFASVSSIAQAGDGMQRYRLRLLPYLYCVAAVGWVVLWDRRRSRPVKPVAGSVVPRGKMRPWMRPVLDRLLFRPMQASSPAW
jgi:4-amino-4-deoxy-L-arabinose transferase-like glycosyltransferase